MGLIRIIIDFIKGLFGFGPKKPGNKREEILIKREEELRESIKKIDKELKEPIEKKDTLEDELKYWKDERNDS